MFILSQSQRLKQIAAPHGGDDGDYPSSGMWHRTVGQNLQIIQREVLPW